MGSSFTRIYHEEGPRHLRKFLEKFATILPRESDIELDHASSLRDRIDPVSIFATIPILARGFCRFDNSFVEVRREAKIGGERLVVLGAS